MMNTSIAIFLLDGLPLPPRCIAVAYQVDEVRGKPQPSNIKTFKTFDPTIQKDDLVVIPTDTRLGFTVGLVTEVDLQVDFNSHEVMRWIVGPVPLGEYKSIIEQEVGIIEKVNAANREALRRKLAADMMANSGDVGGIVLGLGGPSGVQPPKPTEADVTSGRGGAQADSSEAPPARPTPAEDFF